MNDVRVPHMIVVKHILRYLKVTHDYDMLFSKGDDQNETIIEAFFDSDWCGDLFKYMNSPISWCSKK